MATHKDFSRDSIYFRVKAGSEIDKMARAMLTDPRPYTEEELVEIGGLSRSAWLMRQTDKWFDNIRVNTEWGDASRAVNFHYVDVMPNTPEAVGKSVGKSVGKKENEEYVSELEWPQAPPIIDMMENFQKPSWFEIMATMVENGSHISLSGPPGVGKDTAVEQLAAREGRPLVAVSGDGGFRRRDLVGTTEIFNGASYFSVAEYAAAVVNGWWVLITEVNAADADALLFINSQLAPPYIINIHGKAYPVHKDFRLFVSYNPGLAGTKPLPPAFKDRFFPIKLGFFSEYELTMRLRAWGLPQQAVDENYSMTDEDGKVVTASWPKHLVKFGMEMWKAHQEKGQMRYQISVRRLIDAITLMRTGAAGDIFTALNAAVIDTIDSQVEAKVAERILREVRNG